VYSSGRTFSRSHREISIDERLWDVATSVATAVDAAVADALRDSVAPAYTTFARRLGPRTACVDIRLMKDDERQYAGLDAVRRPRYRAVIRHLHALGAVRARSARAWNPAAHKAVHVGVEDVIKAGFEKACSSAPWETGANGESVSVGLTFTHRRWPP